MSTLIQPQWTMQQAKALGFSVWEAYFANWGTGAAGTNFYPDTTATGDTLGSVAAISIGARSTVDRVMIAETLPTPLGGLVAIWNDGFRVIGRSSVCVGSPLRTPASGPLVILPWVEYPAGTTYQPDGGAIAPLPLGSMDPPELHIQFFLKNVPGATIPLTRNPMFRERTVVGAAAGVEAFSWGWPVQGRRRARLHFNVSAGTVTFRVAGIMAPGMDGASVGGIPIERTIAEVAGITGNNTAYIDTGLAYDWLMVYRTVTAGPANFMYSMIAQDEGSISGVESAT